MRLDDLTGKHFGLLTVIERGNGTYVGKKNPQYKTTWICQCDCGNRVEYISEKLKKGEKYSCGCTPKPRKTRLEDLTGKRFGRLIVLNREPTEHVSTRWKCKCDCGNECVVIAENLKKGHTNSCGCYREEVRPKNRFKHGYRHTRIYSVWCGIKDRCYGKNNPRYKSYGGRGITMCDEWKNNPVKFIEWAYKNGYDENAAYGQCTLERVNNDKGYSPDNCIWTNAKVQANNRRSSKKVTYNGETHTVAQWAEKLNINVGTMVCGLLHGKTIEYYVNDFVPRNTHPNH